jgi:hypothetical protein
MQLYVCEVILYIIQKKRQGKKTEETTRQLVIAATCAGKTSISATTVNRFTLYLQVIGKHRRSQH